MRGRFTSPLRARRVGERPRPGASTAAAHVGGPARQQRAGTTPAAASSSLWRRDSSSIGQGRSGSRKEERERADGWARFLQGQRNSFMRCGVLETRTQNHSVLCTKSTDRVCCAQNRYLRMCHEPISQRIMTMPSLSLFFANFDKQAEAWGELGLVEITIPSVICYHPGFQHALEKKKIVSAV